MFGKQQTWGYRQIYAGKVTTITEHGRILIPAAEVDRIVAAAGIYNGEKKKAVKKISKAELWKKSLSVGERPNRATKNRNHRQSLRGFDRRRQRAATSRGLGSRSADKRLDGERDLLRLSNAVLTAQVTVGAHCQGSAVLVAKPAGNGWDVHSAFDSHCGEEVPQIVMGDSGHPDFLAGTIHRFLVLVNEEDFCSCRLVGSVRPHPLEEFFRLGNHRHPANFTVLGSVLWIAFYHDLATRKIEVTPFDVRGFGDAATGEGEPLCEVGTVLRIPAVPGLHFLDEGHKLRAGRQLKLLGANRFLSTAPAGLE